MSRLDPWIIEQLEEEARRREEEAAQRHRIELPQTAPAHVDNRDREHSGAVTRVQIVPISPPTDRVDGNVVDL